LPLQWSCSKLSSFKFLYSSSSLMNSSLSLWPCLWYVPLSVLGDLLVLWSRMTLLRYSEWALENGILLCCILQIRSASYLLV
jgi:hypothetical protein